MTHGSVFSGIGGPEVAASMLGWENLFHCEINPFGRQILDYYYPNAESYEDITKTDFTKWRGKVNVLTGGFPCQPFSYAGRRGGANDDRYLWPSMFRCIDEIKPDWVVAENVPGVTSMVEQGEIFPMARQAALFDEDNDIRGYQLRETFTIERICNDLERHGYAVQPVLIPACAVGAPHRRDRVFIIAHADGSRLEGWRQANGETMAKKDGTRQGNRTERPCDGRSATDTEGKPSNGVRLRESEDSVSGSRKLGGACGTDAGSDEREVRWRPTDPNLYRVERDFRTGLGVQSQSGFSSEEPANGYGDIRCERRWLNFPTVAPVHRGNDGLPFSLDDLTISPTKWRVESLKAYGNAIVPQVMYEIFRAIELVTLS